MPFLLVSVASFWVSHKKTKMTHVFQGNPKEPSIRISPTAVFPPKQVAESLSILSHPSRPHIHCGSHCITKGEDLRKGDRIFPYIPVRNDCLLQPVCFSMLLERKLSLQYLTFFPSIVF